MSQEAEQHAIGGSFRRARANRNPTPPSPSTSSSSTEVRTPQQVPRQPRTREISVLRGVAEEEPSFAQYEKEAEGHSEENKGDERQADGAEERGKTPGDMEEEPEMHHFKLERTEDENLCQPWDEVGPGPQRSHPTRPHWWFEGRSLTHQDYFIDLRGKTTDHLPDVRQYLLLVWERSRFSTSVEPSVPSQYKDYSSVSDEVKIELAKKSLLKSWGKGHGCFLDPKKLGRDYGRSAKTCSQVSFPWDRDVLAGNKAKGRYGDRTARFINDPDPTYPGYWTTTAKCDWDRSLLRTNIRCPLPMWEWSNIDDLSNWWKAFIYLSYSDSAHPASRAVMSQTVPDSVDFQSRYSCLSWYLKEDWMKLFLDLNEDSEDEMD